MPRVIKRFIYQRATWLAPITLTLQKAFHTAYRAKRGKNRQQPLDEGGESIREAIQVRENRGCLFGKLVMYTHGMKHETIKRSVEENVETTEGSQPPPDGEEWSSGALYFVIDGDHVGLAQSMSLKIDHLEAHLNWLMRRSKIIDDGNAVALHSCPPAAARKVLQKVVPKSVSFSRPVELGREDTTVASRTFSGDATMAALQGLLGIDDLRQAFAKGSIPTGRVKTEIKLSWSEKVGGERPEAFLSGLGRIALRHIDEEPSINVAIETKAGTFTSRQLSLAQTRSLHAPDGVVPTSEVYRLLFEFLQHLREENELVE